MNSNSNSEKTKLERKFAFWYRICDDALLQSQGKQIDKKEYETQVKKIADFETVINTYFLLKNKTISLLLYYFTKILIEFF
jgi:hypothetical protein